jgi:hypothetical protein
MPDSTHPFEHLEILHELRADLVAAAHRQEATRGAGGGLRSWLARRLNAPVMAVVLLLAGGAVAVAATGVLSGSPVKQQGKPRPNAGFGLPVAGGSHLLALQAPDPQGGLPWGMRVVRTTRGETCVQIARLDGERLGQLGIDGAFHDDGRFHPLAPDVLPSESDSGDVTCDLSGQIVVGGWESSDRNAAPFPELPGFEPTAKDLRSVSWGLLGPHAVSVTYQTSSGVRTRPVQPGTGAYLIVTPVSHVPGRGELGAGDAEILGSSGHQALAPLVGQTGPVIAATFRFGSLTCSIGHGRPSATSCPMPRQTRAAPHRPARSLHEPVHATLRPQSRESCSAASLVEPCYKAEVLFKAPYSVTSAGSEYEVHAESACKHARLSGWTIERDVRQGETVHSQSTGLFDCTSDTLTVRYGHTIGGPGLFAGRFVVVGAATVRPSTGG